MIKKKYDQTFVVSEIKDGKVVNLDVRSTNNLYLASSFHKKHKIHNKETRKQIHSIL